MTTESVFAERWKELESATHLAFPTWDGKEVEKFLKKMHVEGVDFTRLMALRMARNALTHNPMLGGQPIVLLNPGAIPFLDDVIAHIKKLPMAAHIMIPRDAVFFGSLNDTIASVVETMLKNVFSHVPVLDAEGMVVGVFSESTMLEMNKAGIKDDGKTTLNAVAEFLPCDKHVAEVFRFVPKNDSVAHVRHLCAEALRNCERIGMFFVTENGKEKEPLLGVITVWDIAGVSDIVNLGTLIRSNIMTATVTLKGTIILGEKSEDGNVRCEYEYFANDCATEQKVLALVRHLCDKQGVDTNTIRKFIECCHDINPKLKIYNCGE